MITDSKHVPNKIIRFISFDHIKLYTEFVANDLRAGLCRVQGRQLFRSIRSCLGLWCLTPFSTIFPRENHRPVASH